VTAPSFAIDELSTLRDLEAVRGAWCDLYERASCASPFQHPDWILPWCRSAMEPQIWALAVRSSEKLVGLAPWLVFEKDGRRTAGFLAGGVSDYHDVLVDPRWREEVSAALFGHLLRRRDAWQECHFDQLSARANLLLATAPAELVDHVSDGEPCPALAFAGSRALADVVPGHQLARFRKYARRAERRGRLSFDLAPSSSKGEVLRELFRLHSARWVDKQPDVVLNERLRAFHSDVVDTMSDAACAPELYRLSLADTTVAVLYAFRSKDVLYCYMQAFDPTFAESSPGTLLVGSLLEHACARGVRAVDFLRGTEPYKLAWGARLGFTACRELRRR
jgi:CelD/BcsL family acetyltransferase involved in cellulose biosynthesis